MAKLHARGRTIIGEIVGLTRSTRYMSDRTVLRNIGFGWKIHGKVKPEFSVEEALARARAKQEKALSENVAYAEYKKALHATAGLSKRWKLHAAIELMPDDPDGVWSEACDGYGDNVHADIDEIVELCRLYRAARGPEKVAA